MKLYNGRLKTEPSDVLYNIQIRNIKKMAVCLFYVQNNPAIDRSQTIILIKIDTIDG